MFSKNMKIAGFDNELWDAIQNEKRRQEEHIELIASENHVSPRVLEAQGTVLTNKYAEGYPGRRYYGGCEYVDVGEELARERAKELFGAEKPFFHVPLPVLVPVAAASQLLAKGFGTKSKLEKDTLHYMSCDRIWDNAKLKETGFELEHPDVRSGMKETLDWYKDNGWLQA